MYNDELVDGEERWAQLSKREDGWGSGLVGYFFVTLDSYAIASVLHGIVVTRWGSFLMREVLTILDLLGVIARPSVSGFAQMVLHSPMLCHRSQVRQSF